MDGDNIYKSSLPENGIIVMGNEANGISKELGSNYLSHRLSITFRICSNDRV
jgi:TrmH family RNA methyltransferase